jgi:zinc protease
VLPNGLVLLVAEEHSLPAVSIQLLVDAGARLDPAGEEGLAHLTARGLMLGTATRTVPAIHEALDFMGASLDSSGGRDYATLQLRILKKDLDRGWDLFTDVLLRPAFPEDELGREVERVLGAIQSAEGQPEEVAQKEFQKLLFQGNPYGHPIEGTRESLPKLSREKLLAFYRTWYHPGRAILTVVGDLRIDEVRARLLPALEKWASGRASEAPFEATFAKGPVMRKIDRGISQANIILGHRGVSRDNPDYYALTIMNYILGGGGFSSRLVEEIRNKRGLAYSVASFFDPGKHAGAFQVVLQTKNASAREALSLIFREMERMQKEPVSDRELEGAKKYLIGSFPLRLDTQRKLVQFITQVEYHGLGSDYPERYPSLIRSVTAEEVLRVARKYLAPGETIQVVVADLKEAGLE